MPTQGQLDPQVVHDTNSRFLAMVNWKPAKMASTTSIYKAGQTTTFTMDPTGGYARGIWVIGTVDVTVTLGTGTVAVSPFAPYTLFNRVRVKLGNVIHDVHPLAFPLVYNQSNNAGQDFTYAGPSQKTWAQNVLFGSANGATKAWNFQVSAGTNVWQFMFYIPLQFESDDVTGIVPLGASANKLTLELDPCVAAVGTDPLVNPVVQLTSGATPPTATIGTNNNSLTAVLEFADMNTLMGPTGAGIVVPDPIITQAVYLRDNVTPYPNFGKYLTVSMEEPYQFQRLIAVMMDNYTPVNGTGFNQARPAQNSLISGVKLMYDGQNPARIWEESTGGMLPFWMDQMKKYGDLPEQGIISFDFASGHDPRNPTGQDLLNAALFTQAKIGINYTNPGGPGTGAYVHLIGQYLVPQSYS